MRKLIYIIFSFISIVVLAGACQQVKLSDADKKFAEGEYFTASEMYQKIYRKLPRKDRDMRGIVAWRLAESYRLSNNPVRAVSAYTNATNYNVPDSTLPLQYARTLHKTGDYKKSAEQYSEFLKARPTSRFEGNRIGSPVES